MANYCRECGRRLPILPVKNLCSDCEFKVKYPDRKPTHFKKFGTSRLAKTLFVIFLVVVGWFVWAIVDVNNAALFFVLLVIFGTIAAAVLIVWQASKIVWRALKTQQIQKRIKQQQSNFITPTRPTIPSAVKQYVWQRDGGRCVQCGSNERLEY